MIKVTFAEPKTRSEKPFPKLMINTENMKTIIFAIGMSEDGIEGVCIASTMSQEGTYSKKFIPSKFIDYEDPITIQNI